MHKVSLLSNTAYNAFAKILFAITSLIISAFASRRLTVASFGEGQYLIWLVSIVWLYVNLGLPTAIIRYIAIYSARQLNSISPLIRMVSRLLLLMALIGGGGILFYLKLDRLLAMETVILFIVSAWNSVLQSEREGFTDYHSVFKAALFSSAVALLAFYPFIVIFSIHGLLAIYILIAVIQIATYLVIGNSNCSADDVGEPINWWEISKYSFFVWIAAIISSFMWQRGELFFINHYLTSFDVAYFTVAMSLAGLATQPIALLSSALLPYFARVNEENSEHSQYTYSFMTKAFAWLTFYICFFIAAHSATFLAIIFGQSYRSAATVTSVIVAGSSFGAIATVGSALVYGLGKSWFIAVFGAVGAFAAIACGIYIVPVYGLIAAGISKIAIQIVMVATGSVYIVRYLRYKFPVFSYCKSLAFSALSVALCSYLLPNCGIITVILNLLFSFTLYLILTHLTRVFSSNDVEVFRLFANRLAGRFKKV